ncbi:hypothetical protein ACYSNL_07435 [Enterococcus cecorum]
MTKKRILLLGLLIGAFIATIAKPVVTLFIAIFVMLLLILDFDEYCLKGADQHGKNY